MNKKLSQKQKEIFNKKGKFVVNACAGSGKTFTLSKKLAKLIQENTELHKGIATLSFTNTAWKEIKQNLDKMNVEIKYPHFIGTFDKFINKYIFYPYYYLLDEFDKRPILVGDLGVPWRGGHYERDPYRFFDVFSFNEENELIKTKNINLPLKFKKENKDGSTDNHYEKLEKMKYDLYKKGFVTQDDINYFSLKLIEKFDFISEIIANKFPIFLIDESQDTNEIKMNIMDVILNNNSIKEFMFIGDFNQAIYEWNGAKPEIFKELMRKYETINLDENWRSSKNICKFASKLSKQTINAVNEEIKDYQFVPKINGYKKPRDNENEFFNNIINEFIQTCESNDIYDKIAVLCKGNALIKTINNQKDNIEDIFLDEKSITYDLIHSKFLFENGKIKESYFKLENILILIKKEGNYVLNQERKEFINENGYFNVRKNCFKLINSLPSTKNATIKQWIKDCQKQLTNSESELNKKLLNNIKINEDSNDMLIEKLFDYDEKSDKITISTIHGIKGETFDATLLILRTKPDQRSYRTIVKSFIEEEKMDEELRNIYVAITRPRKILVMAVPEEHEKMWYELFFDDGYRKKGQTSLFEFNT